MVPALPLAASITCGGRSGARRPDSDSLTMPGVKGSVVPKSAWVLEPGSGREVQSLCTSDQSLTTQVSATRLAHPHQPGEYDDIVRVLVSGFG